MDTYLGSLVSRTCSHTQQGSTKRNSPISLPPYRHPHHLHPHPHLPLTTFTHTLISSPPSPTPIPSLTHTTNLHLTFCSIKPYDDVNGIKGKVSHSLLEDSFEKCTQGLGRSKQPGSDHTHNMKATPISYLQSIYISNDIVIHL